MSVFEELATQLSCSCPVCLEKYDITQKCPLIIPCGHTVCQQCVVGLRYHFGEGDGPMKACPVCRTPFTINPRDRKTFGLPMNTQLYLVAEKMLEASKVKPGKLEVKCRDCHQKITVDSCVKCECFANVESGPEKDLLNRDTSKLLCNDCVNRSHKEHNYQTFLEVKNQFKTREIASNLIESSKYKPKIREAAMKLRGTIEKLERLHTSHEICETALKNIAESPFLLEKGAEYIKEFKQMEKTVEEIVKETEKHCEILDRKRQFIQEVFGHVQRGGEPNAKWISERSASAVRLAYPPGLYPPSAVPQFPNRGMGQGYPVQFPIGNHYGMVQFYGFPGPGAPMVPPGIPMWHQGQRQRAQEPPRGPEELPRQVPVLQQEGVRQEVAPQQADQNQDLEIQQEPPRQGPAPQQEVLRQGAPQLAPNNQNQPLQIPQEPLGQGPEHQPPAVHAPVPQYGVPVDVQNMPLQFLIENRYRMRPVYGFPRRGAPMVPPGLQLFPQGQWQRAQEPPRGPGAQQEAPQLAPLNQDLEIRQEPPRQDPGPLVGPQNQNQPLGIPQEPLGQAPEPQQGPAPAAQDEVQDGRNNLIMDIDRMIDQVFISILNQMRTFGNILN
uniref:RING-type domain-containing protein n=1 Tax=Caenorhabditis tropicalis TaxID=1561998 RepID=A0A1I7UV59_9PELO